MTEPIMGQPNARGLRGVIVAARFNEFVTDRLVEGALAQLGELGAEADAVQTVRVPGAWEIPLATAHCLHAGDCDYVVAIGALIRGETYHFDVLSDEVTRALSSLSLETGVPIGMGVLTVETVDQARARAGRGSDNKGREAAAAAVEMATLAMRLRGGSDGAA